MLDTQAADALVIMLTRHPLNEVLRDGRAGELRLHHSRQASCVRDWHEAGQDGDVDAGRRHALDELEIKAVVEEHLSDQEVAAGFHLELQVSHLVVPVGAFEMTLGAARRAEPEAVSGFADEGHEVTRVGQ